VELPTPQRKRRRRRTLVLGVGIAQFYLALGRHLFVAHLPRPTAPYTPLLFFLLHLSYAYIVSSLSNLHESTLCLLLICRILYVHTPTSVQRLQEEEETIQVSSRYTPSLPLLLLLLYSSSSYSPDTCIVPLHCPCSSSSGRWDI